jgi:DNA-binding NarL/FixJ family response regulator
MNTKPVSVIIIESQRLMLTALSTALSAENMTILAELTESRHAMETAKRLNPDLILFSVSHPSLIDLQRISALRQELPAIWLLALVTGELRGQEQSALEHGAHAVVTKSVPRSDLLKAIKQLKKSQFTDSLSTH